MALSKDEYVKLHKRMIEQDAPRDRLFDKVQRVHHLDWELPPGMREEMRIKKVVATDPYDSIEASKRVFASLPPKIKILPLRADDATARLTNERERNLRWQLMSANRLRSETVENEVMESSLLYKSIAAMPIHIGWQIKANKKKGLSTTALERAQKISNFAISTHSPRDVHVRRSHYGVQGVLLCQERTPFNLIDEWGGAVEKALEKLDEENKNILYFDYWDDEMRCVYFKNELEADPTWIMMGKHDLPFMPWVAILGESSMESDPAHKFKPMLYPVIKTDLNDNLNIANTLFLNDVIELGSAPKVFESGDNPEAVEVDYTDPAAIPKLAPQNMLHALTIDGINEGVAALIQMLSQQMEFSTVSKSMRGGMLPSGMSFSAYNLNMQVAENQLRPYKTLAERGLAEIFTKMLLWTNHTGDDLYGFETEGVRGIPAGKELSIKPDEIDTDNIYIQVTMTPTTPTDEMRKANVGSLLHQLGASKETILEEAGYEDPQREMEKRWMEDQDQKADDLEFLMAQTEIQMGAAARQQQMQQEAQMAQQRQLQGPVPGGQGFAPNMQGTPPVQAAPEGAATREGVEGTPRYEQEEEL